MNRQFKNTISSIIAQLALIIYGLIIPRYILLFYGSELNGLIHSISQFLHIAVIMELGLGAVIPAAMYGPLANKDGFQLDAIMSSAYRTFHRIALILAGYIAVLIFLFPILTNNSFPWDISTVMIICIGLEPMVSYLIGKPERMLLISDQKGYIVYWVSAIISISQIIVGIVLIKSGGFLTIVKLASSILLVGKDFIIYYFVKCHYKINRYAHYESEPIQQKWNGIAQHLAYIILENTDIIVLSIFMNFREVSIYSVYYMVITGIKRILCSVISSVQPKLGELWVNRNNKKLNAFYESFEVVIHLVTVFVFTCMGILIVPFVKIYTEGINDADYVQPLFAILLTVAYGLQCLRDPYDKLILASGHFRQTQLNYIIAAVLNVGISVLTVRQWGLIGVAIGTLVAMLYQVIYMVRYDSSVILKRPLKKFARQICIDCALVGIIVIATSRIKISTSGFLQWIGSAFLVIILGIIISGVVWKITWDMNNRPTKSLNTR